MRDSIVPGILLIAIVVLSLALTVVWIITAINAAQTSQWAWFVVILIFGPLVSLIYYAVAYQSTTRPNRVRGQRRTRRDTTPRRGAAAR